MTLFNALFILYPLLFVALGLMLGRGDSEGERPEDFFNRPDYATRRAAEEERARREERGEQLRGRLISTAGIQLVISGCIYLLEQDMIGIALMTVSFVVLLGANLRLILEMRGATRRRPPSPEKNATMNRFAKTKEENRKSNQAQRQRVNQQTQTPPRDTPRPEGSTPWAKSGTNRFTYKSLGGYLAVLYGSHVLAYVVAMLSGGTLLIFAAIGMYFFTQYLHNNSSTLMLSPTEREKFNSLAVATKNVKGYLGRVALPVYLVTMVVFAIISVLLFMSVGVILTV